MIAVVEVSSKVDHNCILRMVAALMGLAISLAAVDTNNPSVLDLVVSLVADYTCTRIVAAAVILRVDHTNIQFVVVIEVVVVISREEVDTSIRSVVAAAAV